MGGLGALRCLAAALCRRLCCWKYSISQFLGPRRAGPKTYKRRDHQPNHWIALPGYNAFPPILRASPFKSVISGLHCALLRLNLRLSTLNQLRRPIIGCSMRCSEIANSLDVKTVLRSLNGFYIAWTKRVLCSSFPCDVFCWSLQAWE